MWEDVATHTMEVQITIPNNEIFQTMADKDGNQNENDDSINNLLNLKAWAFYGQIKLLNEIIYNVNLKSSTGVVGKEIAN